MLIGFLLALREGLEAALVIGIVVGALRKVDRPDLRPAVWSGSAAAILVSFVAALFLHLLGAEFEGRAEQIFEGSTMLVAVAFLTWMMLWMRQAKGSNPRKLSDQIQKAANQGAPRLLFGLAFLAVVREGLELALFLTASALAGSALAITVGAAIGLAASASLGLVIYLTSRKLSLKQFFQATNVFLILFAGGLVSHAMHEFIQAGLAPALLQPVWNLSRFLSDQSVLGQTFGTLFGYTSAPSLTEIIVYVGFLALILLLFRRASALARRTP